MGERTRSKIAEILGAEPRGCLPPEVAERVRAIADRAVAAQES
jgi:hypothetical protein